MTTTKSINRGRLLRQAKAGKVWVKCTFHLTDDYAFDNANNNGRMDEFKRVYVREEFSSPLEAAVNAAYDGGMTHADVEPLMERLRREREEFAAQQSVKSPWHGHAVGTRFPHQERAHPGQQAEWIDQRSLKSQLFLRSPLRFAWSQRITGRTKEQVMLVKVKELKAGDYVVPAKATVKDVQLFAGCLAIVDFDDNTATPPINREISVEITRGGK